MSKTEHDEEKYEASIAYNQYLEWVIKKLAMSCGFIEAMDSSTSK